MFARWLLLALVGLCVPGLVQAEPAASPADEIARLIRDLDADAFAERQAATQKLADLGAPALPALEAAAAGESREAATRAFDVLKKHLEGKDAALQAAAKQTFERLAKSDNAALARRAAEALAPKPEPSQPTPNAIPLRIGGIGGGIRVVAAAGGAGRKISVRVQDGVKTIEAEEGDRKVKIVEDPAKGIQIEATEKKDGKEETKKYEAKDADELKKNHPEGHKLYEQYGQQMGGIRIAVGGAGIAIGGAAGPARADALERSIEALKKHIETLKKNENIPAEHIQAIEKTLERQKKLLEDAKAEVEKAEAKKDEEKKPAEKQEK